MTDVGTNNQSKNVPWPDALRFWAKLGFISFGGPAGQIAIMHQELVEERRWISEDRFLHALNYCMLLPGPEAQQLAVYIGWLFHGIRGGLVAGILFVLPGAFIILLLSILYAGFQELTFVAALFFGIKAAVLAIVIEAVLRIGKRALKTRSMYAIAATAFVGIFFFNVPFPLIIVAAALVGLCGARIYPTAFGVGSKHGSDEAAADNFGAEHEDNFATRDTGTPARTASIVAILSALWLIPVAILAVWLGSTNVFTQQGVFFSKMAVVTFGGAYAVLAYVAQQAVDHYGWLEPGEMLDGLGLAETTPGPLIMVVQFVGFLGAYRNPGMLDPLLAGTLGAILTTWVTFVPCFLWIFLGAPYIDRLRGNRTLGAGLAAVTAAVVGVVLNLAIWFAMHTLFAEVRALPMAGLSVEMPVWETLDPVVLLIAGAALIAMLGFKLKMLTTLAGCAALGILYQFLSA